MPGPVRRRVPVLPLTRSPVGPSRPVAYRRGVPTTASSPSHTARDIGTAWLRLAEIAVWAPVVIGHRTARMLTGGWPPSARDRREYTRMCTEKASELVRAAGTVVSSTPGPATMVQVLTPVRNTVRGNARRLSRTR